VGQIDADERMWSAGYGREMVVLKVEGLESGEVGEDSFEVGRVEERVRELEIGYGGEGGNERWGYSEG
jgi:hypothetical protein